jgi:ABC-2 type transport system permease protein
MSATLLIARRELGAYLRSMTGYVIAAAVLLINGLLFNAFALGGTEKLSAEVLGLFFYFSSGTTTVHDWEIVLGKFLSAFTFLALITLATVYMPALIFVNGKVSFGHMVAGYLGLLLLGSATLAIGTFGSALARTQVLAAIFSGLIVVALIVCWLLAKVTEHPFNDVFVALALHGRHFPPFQQGAVHARDVVYYLMVTYVALFAATRVMEARRWR